MAQDMIRQFESARLVSVPLVVVVTVDQVATERALVGAIAEDAPAFRWDSVHGNRPINKAAVAAAKAKPQLVGDETVPFAGAMMAAEAHLPQRGLLVAHNAQRQLQAMEPGAVAGNVQAVANLREAFKGQWRMLAMLTPTTFVVQELDQDVVVLDHQLPTAARLAEIVEAIHVSAKLPKPKAEVVAKATDALCGLSEFAAEQATAMSLTEGGLDVPALWERNRKAIERTAGLSVWRGRERFADVVGCDTLKRHLRNRIKARTPLGVVLWLDEIDKVFANVEGDTSGVRMDQFRTFLTEMEDNEWPGMVAVGVPGAGKSLISKAFANEAGVPLIAVDMGGMESKFVGESEANMRNFMRIAKAVGRGHAYIFATSNNATVMRPELQRRFTDGMWFFDLMSDAERAAAWQLYVAKYELTKAQTKDPVDDALWTAAEVRNCARYAWDTGCTLAEAARFIVPMARSRGDEIDALRRYAGGRFLDVAGEGHYQYAEQPALASGLRAIALPQGSKAVN